MAIPPMPFLIELGLDALGRFWMPSKIMRKSYHVGHWYGLRFGPDR
jgi:hypothetical protein